MNLMGSRLIHLLQSFQGYLKTGVPLIEFDGKELVPSLTYDDIGIYVIIPKIAYFLNIPLEIAITGFFSGLIFISFVVSAVGFCLIYKNLAQRIIAVITLMLLARVAHAIGDVYIASYVSSIAIVPWILYCIDTNKSNFQIPIFFMSGILIGFLHYIRAHAGTATIFFIVTYLVLTKTTTNMQKMKLTIILAIGLLIPIGFFNYSYDNYRQYMHQHFPEKKIGSQTHVFWHNVYIGLGFLNFQNPDQICYDDRCGEQKVLSINPEIRIENTEAYENILKWEVLRLIRSHFTFVINTIFAKIGVLLYYFLRYANVGLLCFLLYPFSVSLTASLVIALLFNALFGILTMPSPAYCLGFISFAALFAIVGINHVLGLIRIDLKKILYTFEYWKKRSLY